MHCRLHPQLLSKMMKSPSSSLETSGFGRSISFKGAYDVVGVDDQHSDNSFDSLTTVITNDVMITTTPAAATSGKADDSAIGKHA